MSACCSPGLNFAISDLPHSPTGQLEGLSPHIHRVQILQQLCVQAACPCQPCLQPQSAQPPHPPPPLTPSLTQSLPLSLSLSLSLSLPHTFTDPPTHSLTLSLSLAHTDPQTHPLTHSLTHSLTDNNAAGGAPMQAGPGGRALQRGPAQAALPSPAGIFIRAHHSPRMPPPPPSRVRELGHGGGALCLPAAWCQILRPD